MRYQQQAAAILQADENVDGFMSAIGSGGRAAATNQGRFIVKLKPAHERKLDADGVARQLTRKLSAVAGIRVYFTNPPPINIGGRSSKSLYQYTLQGSDIDQLYATEKQLEAALSGLPPCAT